MDTGQANAVRRVFVLMPFSPELQDVFDLVLKQLEDRLPVNVERADELPFQNRLIYDRIIESVDGAEILIADLTGKNANVFYEIGYAHARCKPVIPISSDPPGSVPFDLAGFPIVFYDRKRLADLRKRLEDVLKNVLSLLKHTDRPPDPILSAQQNTVTRVREYAIQKAMRSNWQRPGMYFSESELVDQGLASSSLAYPILDALRRQQSVLCVNWGGESVWMASSSLASEIKAP